MAQKWRTESELRGRRASRNELPTTSSTGSCAGLHRSTSPRTAETSVAWSDRSWDDVVRLPERNRFVRGLRAWVGRRQVGVPYERHARFAGAPKYTIARLVGLAYDGLFSFSVLPVRLMQVMGFLVSSVSLAVAFGHLVWYFVAPERFPTGFATLTISLWFLGGIQLFFLGIVGEYVARSFDESRRRPVAIVREVVGHDQSPLATR